MLGDIAEAWAARCRRAVSELMQIQPWDQSGQAALGLYLHLLAGPTGGGGLLLSQIKHLQCFGARGLVCPVSHHFFLTCCVGLDQWFRTTRADMRPELLGPPYLLGRRFSQILFSWTQTSSIKKVYIWIYSLCLMCCEGICAVNQYILYNVDYMSDFLH